MWIRVEDLAGLDGFGAGRKIAQTPGYNPLPRRQLTQAQLTQHRLASEAQEYDAFRYRAEAGTLPPGVKNVWDLRAHNQRTFQQEEALRRSKEREEARAKADAERRKRQADANERARQSREEAARAEKQRWINEYNEYADAQKTPRSAVSPAPVPPPYTPPQTAMIWGGLPVTSTPVAVRPDPFSELAAKGPGYTPLNTNQNAKPVTQYAGVVSVIDTAASMLSQAGTRLVRTM